MIHRLIKLKIHHHFRFSVLLNWAGLAVAINRFD